jgi:rhodanese-related sulfurtransferase
LTGGRGTIGFVMPQVPTVWLDEPPERDGEPLDGVLLDVREDDEWAAGHAPHAVHLPDSGPPQVL